MATPLIDRLRIKPSMRVLLLNPIPEFGGLLGELPDDVAIDTTSHGVYDCVILFVRNAAEADRDSASATAAVKPGGLLWTCYPKVSGSIKTDITRDKGWDALVATGWRGIASIRIDETWSAVRWRPEADVRSKEPSGT